MPWCLRSLTVVSTTALTTIFYLPLTLWPPAALKTPAALMMKAGNRVALHPPCLPHRPDTLNSGVDCQLHPLNRDRDTAARLFRPAVPRLPPGS
jgi:hypothetical protein